jgi:ubiquinone/menaquinone biosynthesis C-methylase UbiE
MSLYRNENGHLDQPTESRELEASNTQTWIREEQQWWQDYYRHLRSTSKPKYMGTPNHPLGINHYYREMMFRQVRPTILGKFWIDVGAGDSYTIADLLHPAKYGYSYIATDISIEGLINGRSRTGQTPLVCNALHFPFSNCCVSIVSGFGILHHAPSWQQALRNMIDLLEPGGYLLLHESITKPRFLGRWRKQSLTADIDSPHEGDIDAEELKSLCKEWGELLLFEYSGSPLRFVLVSILNLERICLRSYLFTKFLVLLDDVWIKTVRHFVPSLGAGEVSIVLRKS